MVRSFLSICGVSVFLAACSSGGESSASASPAASTPAPAKTVASASGSTSAGTDTPTAAAPYVSKDGGYQIDFHGATPTESTKDDPNGGTWQEAALNNGHMVQYTDYESPAHAKAEVQGFIPTRDKDQIKRDEAVTFAGLSGRDIELKFSSGKMFWIRFLIDGRRVFKIGALYAGDNANAKAFMESFKRVGGAAPATSASAAK